MKPQPKIPPGTDIFEWLTSLDAADRLAAVAQLGDEEGGAIDSAWERWAHQGQLPPDDAEWQTWVIKAGRGFGKTLAGAQWIAGLIAAHENTPLRIALVGATIGDTQRVMVEGRSGLLETAGHLVSEWTPSMRRLRFKTGAEAVLFSGGSPDMLRGPEHHYAWCDELAKWEKPQECWDMLQMGLRLGQRPRALVTTTPASGPVLTAIMEDDTTRTTGGSTMLNPHLPQAFRDRMQRLYAGTRLGRQEIDGEVLPDVEGALWTVELIERCRLGANPASHAARPELVEGRSFSSEEKSDASTGSARTDENNSPKFTRTLIAIDPPTGDGTCGIVACAIEYRTDVWGSDAAAHILADHSVTGRSPEGWSAAVSAAAKAHGTQEIVAEGNQGGEMVKAVLLNADPDLRVKMVHAKTGKSLRAEPVAHLFEAGRVWLHHPMPQLEAQLLGMIAGGDYKGPGHSPDRADAMVWGVTELLLNLRPPVRVQRL